MTAHPAHEVGPQKLWKDYERIEDVPCVCRAAWFEPHEDGCPKDIWRRAHEVGKETSYMACEKCWSDAYLRSYGTGRSQVECYRELLEERKNNPCTEEQQRGAHEVGDEGGRKCE